jgi:hypothetical protein
VVVDAQYDNQDKDGGRPLHKLHLQVYPRRYLEIHGAATSGVLKDGRTGLCHPYSVEMAAYEPSTVDLTLLFLA